MDTKFINLKKEILNFLDYKKFSEFLPVQKKSIPFLNKRKSVFVEAPTGTGKTLSFLIPILNNLDLNDLNTQAIIITPTRELSIQINNILKELKSFFEKEIKSTLAIGSKDFDDQIRKIKNGSQIIIGTLDRINSLRKKTNHNLNSLKYFVIDEVDMIFNFNSSFEFEEISKYIPTNTTLSFFSATFPLELQNNIKKIFKKEIKNIIIKNKDNDLIISNLIKSYDGNKIEKLIQLINSSIFNPYFSIIFAKTNEEVEYIYNKLKNNGVKNLGLFNSSISHREKNRLLKKINNSELLYLVTTDAMSRGMDFPGVTHIINFSLPEDLNYYKHRIGRTNRNNVKGNIYDIYDDSDLKKYDDILLKNNNIKFKKNKIEL